MNSMITTLSIQPGDLIKLGCHEPLRVKRVSPWPSDSRVMCEFEDGSRALVGNRPDPWGGVLIYRTPTPAEVGASQGLLKSIWRAIENAMSFRFAPPDLLDAKAAGGVHDLSRI